MSFLVSAKGSDVTVWRASGDFSAGFRQALLNKFEYCGQEEARLMLAQAIQRLEELAVSNDTFCRECERIIGEVRTGTEPPQLRELTTAYYAALYDHVSIHHSAPAFYQASSAFLQALSGAVWRHAAKSLRLAGLPVPETALIALGPAGRQEFSPFCPLQLISVSRPDDHHDAEAASQLGQLIHEGFEASGLKVDTVITPRNPQWRGTLSEWQQRLPSVIKLGKQQGLIDLLRLADQFALVSADGLDTEFGQYCRTTLRESRSGLSQHVAKVMGLSNGIGIMGGIRLEKRGPNRGMFALVENALQPLSASVSAIALLKGLASATIPQRIREDLQRRELNVDMAERMLQSWHALHEMRLGLERDIQPDWSSVASCYLELDRLNDDERDILRSSLDTVGSAQRHVGVVFEGMEG